MSEAPHLPLSDDPEYPALLRDLYTLIADNLKRVAVDAATAEAIAETVVEDVREHHGGVPYYWPKGTTFRARRRRLAMWEAFNGRNHVALAREYGMCLQNVYKHLKRAKVEWLATHQGGLFTPADAPVPALDAVAADAGVDAADAERRA